MTFSGCRFHVPLDEQSMEKLGRKRFSEETNKKVPWVRRMFKDWKLFRNSDPTLLDVKCDLEDVTSFTREEFINTITRFLTEVKKLDGTDFPGKTLYDIVICLQFHLESAGLAWKLLSNDEFIQIRYTLDNLMKDRTARGIGVNVRKAQILNQFDEDLLWSLGLLGSHSPSVLLDTIVFIVGKGCAFRTGKEHRALCSPPFSSQFQFVHDNEGQVFLRYSEEAGFKTNKGGLKHRKVEPKVVDVYPIEDINKCPVRLFLKYLSKLPTDRKCSALYLQPRRKFTETSWYFDKAVGANKLRDTVKEICKKAGLPGFFTNHSLRSTCATTLYHCNVDEQVIQEITGHRSLSVRSYKRTCDSQRKVASNCIFSSNRK